MAFNGVKKTLVNGVGVKYGDVQMDAAKETPEQAAETALTAESEAEKEIAETHRNKSS